MTPQQQRILRDLVKAVFDKTLDDIGRKLDLAGAFDIPPEEATAHFAHTTLLLYFTLAADAFPAMDLRDFTRIACEKATEICKSSGAAAAEGAPQCR